MTSSHFTGWIAAAVAALVGAGWQLASRHGVTTTLGPLDLAVLRYAAPGLLLAPVAMRALPQLRANGVVRAVALIAGGGLPFGLLALAGAQFAPVAHMAVFMAGAVPLFTALAAWVVERERMSTPRAIGLGAIATGVATMGWADSAAGAWRGDLLFLLAAAAWAAHTIAFRRSGLTPWQGTAVCNAASALALPVVLMGASPSRLLVAPAGDVLVQLAFQAFVAGLLGLFVYMMAVARLGSARASLSGAAVPPLSAAGGALLLRETLSASGALCMAVVVAGIALASGAWPAISRPGYATRAAPPTASPDRAR